MKIWTHDELHLRIDNTPELKAKSDAIHALPEPDSFESAEAQKLQMIEVYTEAVGCRQLASARDACREVYSYIKTHYVWGEAEAFTEDDWKAIGAIAEAYATQSLCHSPSGNDFTCYCANAKGA